MDQWKRIIATRQCSNVKINPFKGNFGEECDVSPSCYVASYCQVPVTLSFAGVAHHRLLQHRHIDALLLGRHASHHPQGGVGDAGSHGNDSRRVAKCCRQYLHWTGEPSCGGVRPAINFLIFIGQVSHRVAVYGLLSTFLSSLDR